MFYVYLLQSEVSRRFYIGSTKDIASRLSRHNAGHSPSTKAYHLWKLVYSESFNTYAEAVKREREIKGWKNSDYMARTLA
jgi:putative endonuclease